MTKEEFISSLKEFNIELTDRQIEELNIYKNSLQEYNKRTNLTRIISDEDVYLKHFYDSLTILKAINIGEYKTLIDVGTGAGFPGLVLKIVFPNLEVTLLDSNNKKTKFLEYVSERLKIDVNIVNERVENFSKKNLNKFDVVTSRAVANLRVLSEICIPLVKEKGYFVPLKGTIEEEYKEATDTIYLMHGNVKNIIKFNLNDNDGIRNIMVIEKNKLTNLNEIRTYDKILKKPLKKNGK